MTHNDRRKTSALDESVTAVTVVGTSMTPTIMKGETVIVDRRAAIRTGDIVLIETGADPLLHRMIGRFSIGENEWLIHMGDNSNVPGIARCGDVVGTVAGRGRRPRPIGAASLYVLALRIAALIAQIGFDAFPIRNVSVARFNAVVRRLTARCPSMCA